MKPPFKWTGGKSRLLEAIEPLLGLDQLRSDFTYFEPFVGGGAVYWHLAERLYEGGGRAILGDVNPLLVNFWQRLQVNPCELAERYEAIQSVPPVFATVRKELNHYLTCTNESDWVAWERDALAAYFLFFINGCFNALWRVNRAGRLNTTAGNWPPKKRLLESDAIAYSELLYGFAEISCKKFDEHLVAGPLSDSAAKKKVQLAFFDPPYIDEFSSYAKASFTLDDHVQLASMARSLGSEGCRVIVCGSNTDKSREVYGEPAKEVSIQRTNGVGARKSTKELIWVFGQD